jgi:hypothetical protein
MKNKPEPSVEVRRVLNVFSNKELYAHLLEDLVSDTRYHQEEVKYLTRALKKDEDIWVGEYKREIVRHQKQYELKTRALQLLRETIKVLNKAERAWNPPEKKFPKKSSKTG